MAQDQHRAGRMLPRPLDLALFMTEFETEVWAPVLPRAVVRGVARRAAGLARRRGLDSRYRELRGRAARARAAPPAPDAGCFGHDRD